MNKALTLLLYPVLLLLGNQTCAQTDSIGLSGWGNNYLSVKSLSGVRSPEAAVVSISNANNKNLNIRNWKLSAKLIGPIASPPPGGPEPIYTGKIFPGDKIRFIPRRTTGQLSPGPLPTVSTIGIPGLTTMNGESEVFIIPNAQTPLYQQTQWGGFYNLTLIFDLEIAGGAYLSEFPADQYNQGRYFAFIQYTLYDGQNRVIGTTQVPYTVDIGPLEGTGDGTTPISYPGFSIQMLGTVPNAVMDFWTKEDYENGVEVIHSDALAITATTSWQVSVRSLSPSFTSANGYNYTLPLDILQIQGISSNGGAIGQNVTLSTVPQAIFIGNNTPNNPETSGNIRYFAKPSLSASKDNYTTVLEYSITPL